MKNMKLQHRKRRALRVKNRIGRGTASRPRMVVFRSNRELFVQLVDDVEGKTLVCVHSFGEKNGGNRESAVRMGTRVAKIAGEKDIDSIVFDRNGFSYQGRVKALAEAAREGGLRF